MSGILLPGQNPAPKDDSGSGLVLPGGFGGRNREKPVEPAPEPTPEVAPAPVTESDSAAATAPAQPAAPRGQVNLESLLFPPQAAQVQCPNCGTRFTVPVFQIVDLGANPELKQPLLQGQINQAFCPQCGTGGALTVPLLIHRPDKNFLGALIPAETRMPAAQSQKAIGDLTQALMRKLPNEERKGYMLQPRQFVDWESLLEVMWEFDGISAESVRRQRAQSELAQSLLGLADDPAALQMALARSGDLIDRQFFAIIDQIMLLMMRQPGPDLQRLAQMRAQLLETTPVGKEIAALQARALKLRESITPQSAPNEILDLLLAEWKQPEGRQVVLSAVSLLEQAFEYEFLLALSERLEGATAETERAALEEIRNALNTMRGQMEQNNQARVQEAQQFLGQVLGAEDLVQALRENRELLDDLFFSLLAANIEQAEKKGSAGAVRRFRQVYEAALDVYSEGLPPAERFMNDLMTKGRDPARLKTLLDENRALITPDFIQTLRELEAQTREAGDADLADLFKSIRAAASLKM